MQMKTVSRADAQDFTRGNIFEKLRPRGKRVHTHLCHRHSYLAHFLAEKLHDHRCQLGNSGIHNAENRKKYQKYQQLAASRIFKQFFFEKRINF